MAVNCKAFYRTRRRSKSLQISIYIYIYIIYALKIFMSLFVDAAASGIDVINCYGSELQCGAFNFFL
jgi:hypothetical protein